MGYETRLHVGYAPTDREMFQHEGHTYLFEVARVDLSKAGYNTHTGKVLAEARQDATETFYWYGGGDTYVTEDLYGDPLTAVPWDALVGAMKADQKEDTYRRFTVALALLAGFYPEEWPGQELTIVQYGH